MAWLIISLVVSIVRPGSRLLRPGTVRGRIRHVCTSPLIVDCAAEAGASPGDRPPRGRSGHTLVVAQAQPSWMRAFPPASGSARAHPAAAAGVGRQAWGLPP